MNKKLDRNYYDTLEIERTADDAAIKKAYRKAALIHHPDKGGSDDMFQQVHEAFQVLSDNVKRSEYDKVSLERLVIDVCCRTWKSTIWKMDCLSQLEPLKRRKMGLEQASQKSKNLRKNLQLGPNQHSLRFHRIWIIYLWKN